MTHEPTEQDPPGEDPPESKAEIYRQLAQSYELQAAQSLSAELREIHLRVARSYLALAENEEWLEGKSSPHAPDGLGTD